MFRLFVVVLWRPRKVRSAPRMAHEGPGVMTVPLMHPRDFVAHRRLRIRRRHFLDLPHEGVDEPRRDSSCAIPRAFICGSGLSAAFSTSSKTQDPIHIPLLCEQILLRRILAVLIRRHAGFARGNLRLVRPLDSRRRHRARIERRLDMGDRLRAALLASRQPAGLRLSLRARRGGLHLFTLYLANLPLMLYLLIFIPILAAVAILLGAPARATALCAAVANLALALLATFHYHRRRAAFSSRSSFRFCREWKLNYFVGADGLSLLMLLLTASSRSPRLGDAERREDGKGLSTPACSSSPPARRRFCLARPLFLLRVPRTRAHPDFPADRHLGHGRTSDCGMEDHDLPRGSAVSSTASAWSIFISLSRSIAHV